MHPRPASQRVVLLVVHRRAGADLRRGLLDRQRQHGGRLQLLRGRGAHVAPSVRARCVRRSPRAPRASPRGPRRTRAAPDQHRRAVVGGVVHRRAREHETVDQRHRQARGRARGERAQRAARDGAVAVDDVAAAGVQGGDDERLAVRRPRCRDARSAPRRGSRRSRRGRSCRVRACAAVARGRTEGRRAGRVARMLEEDTPLPSICNSTD